MLEIEFTAQMKRDAKKMKKRGKDMDKLAQILELLAAKEILPARYRDHQAQREFERFSRMPHRTELVADLSGDRRKISFILYGNRHS